MSDEVHIPFVKNVHSVRILTAEEAAAEREAASNVPLGPHDLVLPIKDAENLRYSPGVQEEIKRVQRAFDRRQAAEARRAALARDARRRYIPPGTPPMLRKLYRNLLPSPDDPRPEDVPPDDPTPEDAPDRSGPTALGGLRSRYPRLFRSPQPSAPSTDDDPTQAALPQDAAPSGDGIDAQTSSSSQAPPFTPDTVPGAAADPDELILMADLDPLPHPGTNPTDGPVQSAANNSILFDALRAGEQADARAGEPSGGIVQPDLDTRGQAIPAVETVAATDPIIGPDPNGVLPGGPWTVAQGQRGSAFYGPKQPGGRAMAQWVPPANDGGPTGSTGYWKTKTPSTPWTRFDVHGSPITPEQAHPNPPPPPAGQANPNPPPSPAEPAPLEPTPAEPVPPVEFPDIPLIP